MPPFTKSYPKARVYRRTLEGAYPTQSIAWSQIGTKLGTKHPICQKLANFMQKEDTYANRPESVILASKLVFYRIEHNAKRETHGIEFRNKIYQRIELKEQMRKIFFIFTPRVMVIKMLKMAHFLYFLLIIAKNVGFV